MKIGYWNIRGLGRAEKKRAVRKLLVKRKFDFLYIQETKHNVDSSRLQRWLWGNSSFSWEMIGSKGSVGGCYLVNLRCAIGNVNAPNADQDRGILWEELGSVIRNLGVPCCIAGDFNVVRNIEEKVGLSYNRSVMEQFSDFIEDLGLIDLPLSGDKFTWSRDCPTPTFCRLDRFLVAPEFLLTFSYLVQNLGPRSLSDHNLISLESVEKDWGPIPFRFYNHWRGLKGFTEMIKFHWEAILNERGEKDSLWRQLIICKYGGDVDDLLPSVKNFSKFFGVWRNISKPLVASDVGSESFKLNIGFAIGNGGRIHFWSQEWIEGIILKNDFPRIFALAVLKEGKVNEFGYFEDNKWVWKVSLRRRVFAWEMSQWEAFMALLNEYQVAISKSNDLRWWSLLWMGLLPPKVEVFCWQVFHGKVAVRENLVARGVLQDIELVYPLCGLGIESVNVLDVFREPSAVHLKKARASGRKFALWTRPAVGVLKFNVDGASKGKPGPSDSNEAEYLAIRESFLTFLASPWVHKYKLCVESDSMNAVLWVANPSKVPWRLRCIRNHLENLKAKVAGFEVVYVGREANQVADMLAKEGVGRNIDLLWVNDD
ncbi:hypothetical protein PTKIN_Ptkin01aG0008500 [Pterospermum kingtungense]